MKLTQKHFEYIAAILKSSNFDTPQTANYFADELAKTNPKFKRDLFLKASGVISPRNVPSSVYDGKNIAGGTFERGE